MAAVTAVLAVAALLSGCGSARYAPGPQFSPETHDYLRADDSFAFASCTAMCMEDTALALVTRKGCLEGCDEARSRFTLRDAAFSSRQSCLDALLHAEIGRDKTIAAMKRWCDDTWSHVHNRKGCYLAAERFFTALAPGNVCGSDAVQDALYAEEARRAREEAAGTGPEPEEAEPARTARGARPDAETPVYHSAQPAGPLDPPAYVPPRSGLESAPPETPKAPEPEIRDTPKYRKPAGKNAAETATRPAAPEKKNPPALPEQKPEATPPATPPKQPDAAKNVQETSGPASAPAAETAPSPPPQAPSSRTNDRTDTPAPPVSSPAPAPARQNGPAAQSGPAAQNGPAQPEAPSPEQEGPPVPGLNTNRPVPPGPKNGPGRPESPALMPPLPSMLTKPYETPTIISPQIETPEN